MCPYECVFGFTPKLYLMEQLQDHVVDNLQSYAKAQYKRLYLLSKQMENFYDKEAERRNITNSQELFKVGDRVRIKKQQPKGVTKFHHMPYSVQIYRIKQVRIPTRSYLLEAITENRQPLQFLCHHRRCKKVF